MVDMTFSVNLIAIILGSILVPSLGVRCDGGGLDELQTVSPSERIWTFITDDGCAPPSAQCTCNKTTPCASLGDALGCEAARGATTLGICVASGTKHCAFVPGSPPDTVLHIPGYYARPTIKTEPTELQHLSIVAESSGLGQPIVDCASPTDSNLLSRASFGCIRLEQLQSLEITGLSFIGDGHTGGPGLLTRNVVSIRVIDCTFQGLVAASVLKKAPLAPEQHGVAGAISVLYDDTRLSTKAQSSGICGTRLALDNVVITKCTATLTTLVPCGIHSSQPCPVAAGGLVVVYSVKGTYRSVSTSVIQDVAVETSNLVVRGCNASITTRAGGDGAARGAGGAVIAATAPPNLLKSAVRGARVSHNGLHVQENSVLASGGAGSVVAGGLLALFHANLDGDSEVWDGNNTLSLSFARFIRNSASGDVSPQAAGVVDVSPFVSVGGAALVVLTTQKTQGYRFFVNDVIVEVNAARASWSNEIDHLLVAGGIGFFMQPVGRSGSLAGRRVGNHALYVHSLASIMNQAVASLLGTTLGMVVGGAVAAWPGGVGDRTSIDLRGIQDRGSYATVRMVSPCSSGTGPKDSTVHGAVVGASAALCINSKLSCPRCRVVIQNATVYGALTFVQPCGRHQLASGAFAGAFAVGLFSLLPDLDFFVDSAAIRSTRLDASDAGGLSGSLAGGIAASLPASSSGRLTSAPTLSRLQVAYSTATCDVYTFCSGAVALFTNQNGEGLNLTALNLSANAGAVGAIWVSGIGLTSVSITRSSISGSVATGSGGALAAVNADSVIVSNSILSRNSAQERGGAIYVEGAVELWLVSSILEYSVAGISGGAVAADAASIAVVTSRLVNCTSPAIPAVLGFENARHVAFTDNALVDIATMPREGDRAEIIAIPYGMISIADNVQVKCPVGTEFGWRNGSRDCAEIHSRALVTCSPCPAGKYSTSVGSSQNPPVHCFDCPSADAICLGGARIFARQGRYGWPRSDGSVSFVPCPTGYCCPEPKPLTFPGVALEVSACAGFRVCGANRTGPNCGQCEQGYSFQIESHTCVPDSTCWPLAFWGVYAIAIMSKLLFLLVLGAVVWCITALGLRHTGQGSCNNSATDTHGLCWIWSFLRRRLGTVPLGDFVIVEFLQNAKLIAFPLGTTAVTVLSVAFHGVLFADQPLSRALHYKSSATIIKVCPSPGWTAIDNAELSIVVGIVAAFVPFLLLLFGGEHCSKCWRRIATLSVLCRNAGSLNEISYGHDSKRLVVLTRILIFIVKFVVGMVWSAGVSLVAWVSIPAAGNDQRVLYIDGAINIGQPRQAAFTAAVAIFTVASFAVVTPVTLEWILRQIIPTHVSYVSQVVFGRERGRAYWGTITLLNRLFFVVTSMFAATQRSNSISLGLLQFCLTLSTVALVALLRPFADDTENLGSWWEPQFRHTVHLIVWVLLVVISAMTLPARGALEEHSTELTTRFPSALTSILIIIVCLVVTLNDTVFLARSMKQGRREVTRWCCRSRHSASPDARYHAMDTVIGSDSPSTTLVPE